MCVFGFVCVHACVRAHKGSIGCERFSFCIYHAVYRLCTSSMKSFIHSRISIYRKIWNLFTKDVLYKS